MAPLLITGAVNFTAAKPTVTVLGVNLSAGTFPLLTWGSLSGTAPTAVSLPAGVSGSLNVSGNTLNLVITSVVSALAKANNADNLNLPTSWTTGVVPGPSTIAPWNSLVTAPNTTVLGADLTWAGIKVTDPAGLVTINAGNTLTLGAAATDIDLAAAAADLTLNCPLVIGAANVWDVGPGRTLTLGNVVSGSSPVTKQGGGTATLTGPNTFNAGLSLTAGTLNINSAEALGATASTFTIAGGRIDNNSGGAIAVANNNPQAWRADVTFLGTADLDLGAGAVTLGDNRTVTVNANTLTVNGAIGGGDFSLTKEGNGTLVLNGANTFNGGVTLNAGTLTLGGANTFSAGVTLNFGTLNLNHQGALGTSTLTFTTAGGVIGNTSGGLVTLSNNPQAWNADFTFNGPYDLNLGDGAVTPSANRVVTVNAGTLSVDGVIPGTFNLQKSGGGKLALNGLNTFTGQTIIQGGTLQANTIANAGVPSSLGAATGNNSIIQNGNIGGLIGLEYTGNSPASTDRQMRLGNNGNGSNTPGILNNNADPANTLTFSNPNFNVAATGPIATGARTLTLSGSNTGNNTIQGDIINNNATAGGANNIVNLTKTGTGTWLLAGSNTYTGPTTINAGTLLVNGSLAADSTVAVNSTGTLGGTGEINGPATINAGGALSPGTSAGTLTFSNSLTFDASAQVIFDCSSSAWSGNDQVVLFGEGANLTGGGATITINQLGGADTLAATDYLLFDLTGNASSVAADFNVAPVWLPSPPANAANYSIATEGRQVYLKYTASPGANLLAIETTVNGSGTMVGNQNVAAGNSVTVYAIERTAGGVFVTNRAANWSLINKTGGVASGDLLPAGYSQSATFTGHLIGSGQLHAAAPGLTSTTGGTLTVVAGAATQVRVEDQPDGSGAVLAAQNLAPGSSVMGYAITRDAGGNFIANVSATWSLANKVGKVADGDLASAGTSAIFTANNVGSANLRATSGALTAVDSGLITVLADLVWTGAGANWDTTSVANWLVLPAFSPNSAFANDFCSVLFDDNGWANPTVNLVGSLSPKSVTVSGGTSYTLGGEGKITGQASLTNSGTGTLTLQTANDYTGGTTVTAGTLVVSGGGTMGATTGALVVNGGAVDLGGASRTKGAVTIAGGGTIANGTLTGNAFAGQSGTVSAVLAGPGALTKTTTGILSLAGANTYGGGTIISAGPLVLSNSTGDAILGTVEMNGDGTSTLRLGAANQIPDSTILTYNLTTGNARLELQGFNETIGGISDATTTGTRIVQSATDGLNDLPATLILAVSGNSSYGGYVRNPAGGAINSPLSITKEGPGTQTFSGGTGLVSYSGPTVVRGGVLVFSGPNSVANNSAITLAGGTVQFSGGGMRSNTIGGAGTLLKTGNNTLTLSGDLAYLGNTVVSNGTLHVIGSLAAGNIVAVNGGALGGTGTINGAVTVNAGGTLAPGSNAIGTLAISNTLTLAGGSITSIEINQTIMTSDHVVGLTSVAYNGTLVVTNLAGTPALGNSFPLFSSAAASGNFANITPALGDGLAWNFNPTNGVLSVVTGTAVASNPTNIRYSLSGGLLTLTWPASHLGWSLQAQTNSLAVGLSTNWVTIPGSETNTSVVVPVTPANPTVFYRMFHHAP